MKKSTEKILKKEFSEVTKRDISAAIIDKFGSVAYFSRLTKRNVAEMHVKLRERKFSLEKSNTPAFLESVWEDVKRLACVEIEGYHLTEQQRNELKSKLAAYSSVIAFSEKHPQFTTVFVSRITNGYTEKITKKVREFATVLGVKLP